MNRFSYSCVPPIHRTPQRRLRASVSAVFSEFLRTKDERNRSWQVECRLTAAGETGPPTHFRGLVTAHERIREHRDRAHIHLLSSALLPVSKWRASQPCVECVVRSAHLPPRRLREKAEPGVSFPADGQSHLSAACAVRRHHTVSVASLHPALAQLFV